MMAMSIMVQTSVGTFDRHAGRPTVQPTGVPTWAVSSRAAEQEPRPGHFPELFDQVLSSIRKAAADLAGIVNR